MNFVEFPVIDPVATGKNILSLRRKKGLTVRDLQAYFGFEAPQAIYRWQYGKTLPSVDNLYALSALLGVPMEQILVPASAHGSVMNMEKQQVTPAASAFHACKSVHEEIRVRKAEPLLSGCFAHREHDVRFLRVIADERLLRGKEQLKIPCQTEPAAAMFDAAVPV